jgi:hypothetical protein
MRNALKYSMGCLSLLLALSSCRKEPVYDVVPEIEFRRVEQYLLEEAPFPSRPDLKLQYDSLVLVIGFKDGDGNLGLSNDTTSADWRAPFNPRSPYHDNFQTIMYYRVVDPGSSTGYRFVPYPFPDPSNQFSGRFQRLSSDDRPEPLEGEIKYGFKAFNSAEFELLQPGTVIKFDIFIYDRTTPVPNRSNIVTTDEIVLFQGTR